MGWLDNTDGTDTKAVESIPDTAPTAAFTGIEFGNKTGVLGDIEILLDQAHNGGEGFVLFGFGRKTGLYHPVQPFAGTVGIDQSKSQTFGIDEVFPDGAFQFLKSSKEVVSFPLKRIDLETVLGKSAQNAAEVGARADALSENITRLSEAISQGLNTQQSLQD